MEDPLAAFRSSDDSSAARLEYDPMAGDYRRRNGFKSAAVLLLEEAAATDLLFPAVVDEDVAAGSRR
jgi:hypothetical protein